MKYIFALLFFILIFQFTNARAIIPVTSIFRVSLIVQSEIKVNPQNSAHTKISVKERLLQKWYKKRVKHQIVEVSKKKNVKLLGFLSLGMSTAAILLLVFAGLIYSEVVLGIFAFLILCLIPTALILGILSLTKRKKLADKKGTSAIPAILGIILASAILVSFIIALISISINGLF